jgi:hypothetical protein
LEAVEGRSSRVLSRLWQDERLVAHGSLFPAVAFLVIRARKSGGSLIAAGALIYAHPTLSRSACL